MSLKITAALASGLLGLLVHWRGPGAARSGLGPSRSGRTAVRVGTTWMAASVTTTITRSAGYYVRDLPRERFIVGGPRGGRYWYSGGVWYNSGPRGFVVIGAPIGAFVPVLPPYYTTVYFGGVPYYYANDTYYIWR